MDATRPPPGTTMDEMTPLHVAAYVGTYKLLFEAIAANEEVRPRTAAFRGTVRGSRLAALPRGLNTNEFPGPGRA